MSKNIVRSHNGHKCVHVWSAFQELGLSGDPDGRVAELLRGLMRPEGWEESCIRPALLAQVMMERAGGALMNGNRGPQGRSETCTCSRNEDSLWCPSLDRLLLLGNLVSAFPGQSDGACYQEFLCNYPESCLAKFECFEITVIRSLRGDRLRLEDGGLRPLTSEEFNERTTRILRAGAVEKKRILPQQVIPQTYY